MSQESLEARGSWRARHRSRSLHKRGKPKCPKWFNSEQRDLWKMVCRHVSDLRLLTINDGHAIERYVVHLTQWRALQSLISSESSGSFSNAMRDAEVRKLVLIVQTESRRLHKLLQDFEAAFGLTPAARARLVTEKPQQENPIATLLARRGEN